MATPQGSMDRIADLLLDAICVVNAQGVFEYISPAGEGIFGYAPSEMLGRRMTEFIAPFDQERTLLAARQVMAGQPHLHFENCYVRKDGSLVHLMWSARWSDVDQRRYAVARDVSVLKQAEATQAALMAIAEAAHASGDVGDLMAKIHGIVGRLMPVPHCSVLVQDGPHGRSRVAYQAHAPAALQPDPEQEAHADRLFSEAVMAGVTPLLLTPSDLDGRPAAWREAYGTDWAGWLGVPLSTPGGTLGALVLKRYLGESPWTDKELALLQYASTQIATAIERKQLLARLQHMAQFDALTGLPNRYLLHDRMVGALARAERCAGRLSLLFLDLDRFKLVNDTLGHKAGDRLLQEVARRLRECVRDTDTVARIGGDEFVVLLESIQDPAHALQVADKIRAALQQQLHIGPHALQITPSIGVAHYPEDGVTSDQLLGQADEAMYAAKRAGRQAPAAMR
jgi:diguanylate cyclase (GGDEF)-like protein/PAS domain S-box-containing protein